jgi:hypothetical protein
MVIVNVLEHLQTLGLSAGASLMFPMWNSLQVRLMCNPLPMWNSAMERGPIDVVFAVLLFGQELSLATSGWACPCSWGWQVMMTVLRGILGKVRLCSSSGRRLAL